MYINEPFGSDAFHILNVFLDFDVEDLDKVVAFGVELCAYV